MNSAIETSRGALDELCRRFHVERLEVFGSAATGDHGADSDLDFLVEFRRVDSMGVADQYFGLLAALEELYDRRVDLVSAKAMRNPWFIRSVEQTSRLLYAA